MRIRTQTNAKRVKQSNFAERYLNCCYRVPKRSEIIYKRRAFSIGPGVFSCCVTISETPWELHQKAGHGKRLVSGKVYINGLEGF